MYELSLANALVPVQTDMHVREVTIGALLREVPMEKPRAEALVEITQTGVVGQRWTYGELLEDSERLDRALNSRFKLGEHIAVWAPNSPEWVLMEYACALAGLVLVTANPAFQANELRYVLEHSGAASMISL